MTKTDLEATVEFLKKKIVEIYSRSLVEPSNKLWDPEPWRALGGIQAICESALPELQRIMEEGTKKPEELTPGEIAKLKCAVYPYL